MSKQLTDPSDPLATTAELCDNAIEVLDEVRNNVIDDNDPEWLEASFEYVRTVPEAVKDRENDDT
jgi:hypothetical protein